MSIIKQSHKIGLYLVILTLLVFFSGCSGRLSNNKVRVPDAPKVRPVKVIDGTISGESLDNVIDNHTDAWKYIEDLKVLLEE